MKRGVMVIVVLLALAGVLFGQIEADFDIVQNSQGFITITGYRGTAKDVVIPATIEGVNVTAIGEAAFSNNQLTSVVIPQGITSIGERAFSYNQLTSIVIPHGVTSIGKEAFSDNQLTSVTISQGVTSIGIWVFSDNPLTSVTLPANISNLVSYGFPESVVNVYNLQGKKAGTYMITGRIWTLK